MRTQWRECEETSRGGRIREGSNPRNNDRSTRFPRWSNGIRIHKSEKAYVYTSVINGGGTRGLRVGGGNAEDKTRIRTCVGNATLMHHVLFSDLFRVACSILSPRTHA